MDSVAKLTIADISPGQLWSESLIQGLLSR